MLRIRLQAPETVSALPEASRITKTEESCPGRRGETWVRFRPGEQKTGARPGDLLFRYPKKKASRKPLRPPGPARRAPSGTAVVCRSGSLFGTKGKTPHRRAAAGWCGARRKPSGGTPRGRMGSECREFQNKTGPVNSSPRSRLVHEVEFFLFRSSASSTNRVLGEQKRTDPAKANVT